MVTVIELTIPQILVLIFVGYVTRIAFEDRENDELRRRS